MRRRKRRRIPTVIVSPFSEPLQSSLEQCHGPVIQEVCRHVRTTEYRHRYHGPVDARPAQPNVIVWSTNRRRPFQDETVARKEWRLPTRNTLVTSTRIVHEVGTLESDSTTSFLPETNKKYRLGCPREAARVDK